MFGNTYNYKLDDPKVDIKKQNIHFSIMFNTFIWMQIFNFINARKLGIHEINVFERFTNNYMFLGILTFVILAQYSFVTWGTFIMDSVELDSKQNGGGVILAVGVLAISAILKCTPASWVDKIPIKMDESKASDNDPIMKAFNKATGPGGAPKKEDPLNEPLLKAK